MNDRDRLAADMSDSIHQIEMEGEAATVPVIADRLIALGWTRFDIPTRLDARITEPMLRAAMRSAPNLTPHAIWTRLMNLYDFPPDTLDEERLARALYEVDGHGLMPQCREDAHYIAKAYREDTDADN